MEFLLLGPVAARHAGTSVALRRSDQRAVLTALGLRANQVVSVDTLAVAATERRFAPGFVSAFARSGSDSSGHIRSIVAELRQTFRGIGERARIVAREGGYVLVVRRGERDVDEFTRLANCGEKAVMTAKPAEAAKYLRQALRLWRAEPTVLPGLHEDVARLTKLWLTAVEHQAQATLQLGRPDQVIAELSKVVRRYPLRESLWVLLIRAFAAAGSMDEAHDAYMTAKYALLNEKGVQPGAELRVLHEHLRLTLPGTLTSIPAARVS